MTAYGRATGTVLGHEVSVELRSVNSKFLDLSLKLPHGGVVEDPRVRAIIRDAGITRGKVDLYVNLGRAAEAPTSLKLNEEYLEDYLACLRRLHSKYKLKNDITVMSVAREARVFTEETAPEDGEALSNGILALISEAVSAFVADREREGENLRRDISAKLAFIREQVASIGRISAGDVANAKVRIRERLRAVLADNRITVDENRLLTECALWADKIAIDEELVRLSSHLDELETMMELDTPTGRKFDFQLQEVNREVNTIGSKCQNAEIAKIVVTLKNELEKIREQIQNIE